jgi:biopolymer transport protein ExbD
MEIKKFDSINVVPFIDIVLVLLVIVLTTATFIQKGVIEVDVPSADSSVKEDKKSVLIQVDKNNNIYIDKNQISLNELTIKLKTYPKNTSINIECDKIAKFDNFVNVLDILRVHGYKSVGIVTNEK